MTVGRFIVKVQRPLQSSEPNPGALIYDRRRSFYLFAPMTPAILQLLGPELKVYAWAELENGRETLRIMEAAPPQPW